MKIFFQSYFIFTLCFLKTSLGHCPPVENFWLVWNVGQGQWISHITNDECLHYDFGGESFRQRQVLPLFKRLCQNKINRLHLSHADWDHYSLYPLILKNTRQVCWVYKPLEKLKLIENKSPYCDSQKKYDFKILHLSPKAKIKNASSTVVESQQILIPGDSRQKEERQWLTNLSKENKIRILILGHHGSRSSTSQALLHRLPTLKMAIASQRTKKYGHPHLDVRKKLDDFKIPLLLTESWGSIRLD